MHGSHTLICSNRGLLGWVTERELANSSDIDCSEGCDEWAAALEMWAVVLAVAVGSVAVAIQHDDGDLSMGKICGCLGLVEVLDAVAIKGGFA